MALSLHLVRLRPTTEDHRDGLVEFILRTYFGFEGFNGTTVKKRQEWGRVGLSVRDRWGRSAQL
jgi:hypothetical protein